MTETNVAPLTLDTIKLGRHYLIVTDGSGPEAAGRGEKAIGTGGHACILQLRQGDEVLHQKPFASQVIAIATNSRMEMMAPLAAFDAMQQKDLPVLVESDSQFVVNGMNVWRHRWLLNDWIKSDRKPVENIDLWRLLIAADESRVVIWTWVKGHSGHVLNELADKLAASAKVGRNVDEMGRVMKFPKGLSF